MSERIRVSLEVPGLKVQFEGRAELYEGLVRGALRPIAEGRWRGGSAASPSPDGTAPTRPDGAVPADAPAPAPVPAAPAAAAPPGAPPASRPVLPSGGATGWNPDPLYARMAAEKSRRGERDAVLCALVSMATEGKRDASVGEILDHMTVHGFPTRGLKPKPILQKLVHRTTFVEPGILPATFRATPAGSAHIGKRLRER